MTRTSYLALSFVVLCLLASSCSDGDRLDVATFSGRWEAVEVDGKPTTPNKVHYLDFTPDACRFHAVEHLPDGTDSPLHDYTRACVMEQNGEEWRLVFQRERNDYLVLRRTEGLVNLILPPRQEGETERVLSRLKKSCSAAELARREEICRPL